MRSKYIDLLKGWAIILVVISHSFSLLTIKSPFLKSVIGQDMGRLGVLLFFLISGALAYIHYSSKKIKRIPFVINKIKKSYVICLTGTFLMVLLYLKLGN